MGHHLTEGQMASAWKPRQIPGRYTRHHAAAVVITDPDPTCKQGLH